MRKFLIIIQILFLIRPAVAQFNGNVWCWGDSAGMIFNPNGSKTFFTSSVKARGSCVSISDSLNNLLFYASTPNPAIFLSGTGYPNMAVVFNRLHLIMDNGDSLNGEGWYNELVIVPYPNNPNLFILFTQNSALPYGMHYSIIDLGINGGLGKVIQKNIQIMPNPMQFTDCLTAIKHGNGRDWWIICRRTNVLPNDSIYTFLVDPQGVHGPYAQLFGANNPDGFNRTCFNNDGTKMYWNDRGGDLHRYDFNRCTGLFSNKTILHIGSATNNQYLWSSALSPNERYLYLTSSNYYSVLYQLDLLAPNPWNSKVTVDTVVTPFYGNGAFLRKAPDNKIYLSCWYVDTTLIFPYPYSDTSYNMYNMNLSVINQPDSPGTACNFTPFSFYLGGNRTYIGLPNNPNYEMGPLVGSGCDTLTSVSNWQIAVGKSELKIFYHSGWQKAYINAQGLKGRKCKLRIFDTMGKVVYEFKGVTTPPYFTKDVDLSFLSNGLYIVNLETELELLSGKLVKE